MKREKVEQMRKEKVEKRKVKMDSKNDGLTLLFSLSSFFFLSLSSLLFCTCDLFNSQVQDDYLRQIDDEIAWSNAARLDVTVWYNPLWGTSPQQGPLDRETHRQGHYFNVEFTPAPGYGFVDWVAFRTNGLDLTNIDGVANKALILNVNEVNIVPGTNTVGGAFSYKIKINITDPVTLVPLCSDRPRLSSRTYPPLNPVPIAFPYNQKIDIWFNMPVQKNDLKLEEGKITISGTYLINKGGYRIGDDFEEHGNITNFFKLEKFPPNSDDNSVNHVTLIPDGEKRISDLAYLTITVKVGPNINKKNVGDSEDIGMAGAESFSFMTDSSEMKKTYVAYKIRVEEKVPSADPKKWFGDDPKFAGTPIIDPAIDRRFKYNDTLTLSFDIDTREDPPTRVLLIEQRFLELGGGSDIDDDLIQEDFGINEFTLVETYDADEEKEISTYTLNNYPIKTTSSGIIRLLVLPWYFPDVAPIEVDDAINSVRYVNIVIDGEAPDLDKPNVIISNYSRTDRIDHDLYLYGNKNRVIVTIENLGSIVDNTNGGGIPKGNQTYPAWTKNDNDLYWQVMIGENGEITSGDDWLPVYNGSVLNNQWQSDTISALTDYSNGYPVSVRFKDRPGNETKWVVPTEKRVSFRSDNGEAVTGLKAEYKEGNTISVTWTEPSNQYYQHPDIVIRSYKAGASGDEAEGEAITTILSKGTTERTITSVPTITTKDVLTDDMSDGGVVSGVYGYEITVITDNGEEQDEEAGPIWVYNIPDMYVNESNTVRITEADQLTIAAADLGKNIILTKDMVLDSHTPIGTAGAAFTGKFYGNGHTITIRGFNNSYYTGLFGLVNGAALIRDLTLEYDTVNIAGNSTIRALGGIAAWAGGGNIEILNIITRGKLNAMGVTHAESKYIGGITGTMPSNGTIANIYAGLDLSAKANVTTATDNVYFGGITGDTAYNGSATHLAMNKIKVTGTLEHEQTGGTMYTGGVAGWYRAGVRVSDIEFSGGLSAIKTDTGEIYAGGILGNVSAGSFSDCRMSGSIEIQGTNSGAGNIGGIAGQASGTTQIADCTASGTINVSSSSGITLNAGGIVGALGLSDPTGTLATDTARIDNCHSDTIDLSVTGIPSGYIYVGGIAGAERAITTISNCSASGTVDVKSAAKIHAGGIVGAMNNARAKLVNCDSYIGLSANYTGTGEFCVGGITGQIWTPGNNSVDGTNIMIDNVKATGNVTAQSNGGIYLGGIVGDCRGKGIIQKAVFSGPLSISAPGNTFVGGVAGYTLSPSCSFSQCYAIGNITVTTSGQNTVHAGGLMGRFEGSGLISNSYALSNVSVDRTSGTGTIYVGGMVGELYSTSGSGNGIQYCFNKGDVIAKSNGTGSVRIGGMVGWMQRSTNSSCNLDHNAALGGRVAYRGSGDNRQYGRLGPLDYPPVSNQVTWKFNYAFIDMQNNPGTYDSVDGSSSNFFDGNVDGTVNPRAGKGANFGTDTTAADYNLSFKNRVFWTDSAGIAFSEDYWNFNNVANSGYPILKGLGGQE